jgi:hypothetical protein
VLYALNQISITTSQNNARLRHNCLVNKVTVEVLFLALFKLLLLLFFYVTFFIVFNRLVQEAVLSIFIATGVTVQDVTTVSACVLDQLLPQKFVDKFFGDADGELGKVNLGPFFTIWGVTTRFLDLCSHLGALFFTFCLDV